MPSLGSGERRAGPRRPGGARTRGSFVSVLLLARALTPTGRGTVAFVTVGALVTSRVAVLGSGEAAKVLAARRPEVRARVLANLALLTAVTALAGAGIVARAADRVPRRAPGGRRRRPSSRSWWPGRSAWPADSAASAFLQGCGRFGEYTRVLAAAPWLYALLLALAWLAGGLDVQRALGRVGDRAERADRAAVGRVLSHLRPCAAGPATCCERRSAFGLRAWVGGLAYLLNARVDQLLLGVLAGEAALGVYAVAVNASEVLFYLPSAVAAALLPALARSTGDALAEQALRVFRAVAWSRSRACASPRCSARCCSRSCSASAYQASVVPFLLLLPSAVGFAANAVFSSALLASRRPGMSSAGPLVSLPTGIGLDLLLIPAARRLRSGDRGQRGAALRWYDRGVRVRQCAAGCAPSRCSRAGRDLDALARQLRSRLIARRAGARWS